MSTAEKLFRCRMKIHIQCMCQPPSPIYSVWFWMFYFSMHKEPLKWTSTAGMVPCTRSSVSDFLNRKAKKKKVSSVEPNQAGTTQSKRAIRSKWNTIRQESHWQMATLVAGFYCLLWFRGRGVCTESGTVESDMSIKFGLPLSTKPYAYQCQNASNISHGLT